MEEATRQQDRYDDEFRGSLCKRPEVVAGALKTPPGSHIYARVKGLRNIYTYFLFKKGNIVAAYRTLLLTKEPKIQAIQQNYFHLWNSKRPEGKDRYRGKDREGISHFIHAHSSTSTLPLFIPLLVSRDRPFYRLSKSFLPPPDFSLHRRRALRSTKTFFEIKRYLGTSFPINFV